MKNKIIIACPLPHAFVRVHWPAGGSAGQIECGHSLFTTFTKTITAIYRQLKVAPHHACVCMEAELD